MTIFSGLLHYHKPPPPHPPKINFWATFNGTNPNFLLFKWLIMLVKLLGESELLLEHLAVMDCIRAWPTQKQADNPSKSQQPTEKGHIKPLQTKNGPPASIEKKGHKPIKEPKASQLPLPPTVKNGEVLCKKMLLSVEGSGLNKPN